MAVWLSSPHPVALLRRALLAFGLLSMLNCSRIDNADGLTAAADGLVVDTATDALDPGLDSVPLQDLDVAHEALGDALLDLGPTIDVDAMGKDEAFGTDASPEPDSDADAEATADLSPSTVASGDAGLLDSEVPDTTSSDSEAPDCVIFGGAGTTTGIYCNGTDCCLSGMSIGPCGWKECCAAGDAASKWLPSGECTSSSSGGYKPVGTCPEIAKYEFEDPWLPICDMSCYCP